MRSVSPRHRRLLALALFAGMLPAGSYAAATSARRVDVAGPTQTLQDALATPATAAELVPAALAPRRRTPEDRYAMAGGCYVMRSVATKKVLRGEDYVFAGASAPGTPETPEPYYFQPIDLGKYLIVTSESRFVSQSPSSAPDGVRPVTDPAQGYVAGTGDEQLDPVRDPVLEETDRAERLAGTAEGALISDDVARVVPQPSGRTEWVVRPAPGGSYTFHAAVDDHDPDNPGPLNPEIFGTLAIGGGNYVEVRQGVDSSFAARFTLTATKGCAEWPEITTNVSGPHATGTSPYAETKGYFDGHLHLTAFEFLGGRMICGRPWHPYGVTRALVDCPDHAPGGYGALAEQLLAGRPYGHDTTGWPTFAYWPRYDSLTHQQGYYKWLERSWRSGLRIYTNLFAENGVLCEVYPLKKNRCNEMDSVRLQAQRLRELERYIDAQYGGPGEGWFRIVTDPFQARRVVNAGKLAVVMGVEVSVPFDCGEYLQMPRCTAQHIEDGLDEMYAMGVRQMQLINKFDNALGGVTGDDGQFGLLANNGNRYETGHTWKMKRCVEPEGHGEQDDRHDKTQINPVDETGAPVGRDSIFGVVLDVAGESGAAQVYPPGPHCNVIGLSDLGRTAIDGLMKRGMMFDPDHMSASARKAAMEHVAKARYSGVISSHSWGDDPTYRDILRLGGVISVTDGASDSFVKDWRQLRAYADPRYLFGLGYGSDITGFSKQGPPRNPTEKDDVDYPFRAVGGAIVDKQRSGERVYDVNTDGVNHYGLYPDWLEDGRLLAGRDGAQFKTDVENAPEAYLQMWERAIGVPGNACRPDVRDLSRDQVRRVRVGLPVEQVLVALGQPKSRIGRTLTFCGEKSQSIAVRVGDDGRVRSISSRRSS